jgi:hypothetical protein
VSEATPTRGARSQAPALRPLPGAALAAARGGVSGYVYSPTATVVALRGSLASVDQTLALTFG